MSRAASTTIVTGLRKVPALRVHRIGNVHKCLTFLSQSSVQLYGINADGECVHSVCRSNQATKVCVYCRCCKRKSQVAARALSLSEAPIQGDGAIVHGDSKHVAYR